MEIVPAIDLKDGKCVRLLKGEEGSETVFSTNPLDTAKKWESYGPSWMHIVDLDGAFEGTPKNFGVIENIVSNTDCLVQVGGGIRNKETVEMYIKAGVKRVIIGTMAFEDRDLMIDICQEYPGMIAVGIDTKQGKIAVKGWKEVLNVDTEEVISDLEKIGVSMFINTDIDKDGTMEGVNPAPIKSFMDKCTVPVIASGGIATMDDLEKLSQIENENFFGVILGKSIYTGSIDLESAINRFRR